MISLQPVVRSALSLLLLSQLLFASGCLQERTRGSGRPLPGRDTAAVVDSAP
jgi:hypothetical protein